MSLRAVASSWKSASLRPIRFALSAYVGPMPLLVVPILFSPRAASRAASSSQWYGRTTCALSEMRSLSGVTATPSFSSDEISLTSPTGSMTTPLPIMLIFPSQSMPDGMRCRMYFCPLAMTVCPALLPPWPRATMSAVSMR